MLPAWPSHASELETPCKRVAIRWSVTRKMSVPKNLEVRLKDCPLGVIM